MSPESKARLGELLRAGWSVRIEPILDFGGPPSSQVIVTLIAPFPDIHGNDHFFTIFEQIDTWNIESALESAINGAYAVAFPAPKEPA